MSANYDTSARAARVPVIAEPPPGTLRLVYSPAWGLDVMPSTQADASITDPMLEAEFKALSEVWRNETRHLSISSEKAVNFAYQQIIGMGEKVLPLIFRELETATSDWFWALRAIAGRKAPVIPPEDRGRVRRITERWMEWGKHNGYVSR